MYRNQSSNKGNTIQNWSKSTATDSINEITWNPQPTEPNQWWTTSPNSWQIPVLPILPLHPSQPFPRFENLLESKLPKEVIVDHSKGEVTLLFKNNYGSSKYVASTAVYKNDAEDSVFLTSVGFAIAYLKHNHKELFKRLRQELSNDRYSDTDFYSKVLYHFEALAFKDGLSIYQIDKLLTRVPVKIESVIKIGKDIEIKVSHKNVKEVVDKK